MRIVASLTTTPDRYLKLLRTLKSLHNQDHKLDAIYLTIPKMFRRLKREYPPLPSEIKELCTVVHSKRDYGPLTKIVGALFCESDPNTVIVTFDDDVVYSHTLVKSLLSLHTKYPEIAIGSSGILLKHSFPFYGTVSNSPNNWNNSLGFSIPEEGRPVDVLCGFSSVLYLRKFFPDKDLLYEKFLKYPLLDWNVYFNDDVMISAYLSKINVERKIFNNIPRPNEKKIYDDKIDEVDYNSISYDKVTFATRLRNAINKTKEWGYFAETQNVSLDETVAGSILIIIVLLILLLIAIWLLWMQIPKV